MTFHHGKYRMKIPDCFVIKKTDMCPEVYSGSQQLNTCDVGTGYLCVCAGGGGGGLVLARLPFALQIGGLSKSSAPNSSPS